MFDFYDMLGNVPPINVCDVGAMWLSDEQCPYRTLVGKPGVTVVGFEPLADECAKLNAMRMPGHRFWPVALGGGDGPATLYIGKYPMTTSLMPPNQRLLAMFQEMDLLHAVADTVPIRPMTLDQAAAAYGFAGIDYFKTDAQGMDLAIIKGGERTLADAVCIHVEADFVPLYQGQACFGDLDVYLRSRGFLLHLLSSPMGRAFKPLAPGGDTSQKVNQVLWADAVYVRDFSRLDDLTPEQRVKLAAIVHQAYGSVDLAAACLAFDADLHARYLERVCGVPEPAGVGG